MTMFSGGRDSTLAALRLADSGIGQVLVTVTSGHLVGLDSVRTRLRELSSHLPPGTRWLNVRQPEGAPEDLTFVAPTCFPCHKAYATVAVQLAEHLSVSSIAFGYTGYQSAWPEQTPRAVDHLREKLDERGITLLTPVYDVESRRTIEDELLQHGLSPGSLEQKCLVQVENLALTGAEYDREFNLWAQALDRALGRLSGELPQILSEDLHPWHEDQYG